MESLSNILKKMPGSHLAKAIDEQQEQLLKHPLIEQFIIKHPNLTDADLRVNMNRLHQYVTEHEHCTHCPGLVNCPNDFQGHYTRLTVDQSGDKTFVHDHKVSCQKWLAEQNQQSLRQRIRSFYIDDRALNEGYSADDIISIDPERTKAAAQVLKYITQAKKDGLTTKGLYLVGPFGTGKTFLMCYLLHELAKTGLSGVIVYVPDFMEDLKGMFQEPSKLKDTIDLLKETDLLIFDDIGAENLSPWARDHIMGTILNYRMNRKPTLYTSNYDLNALEKHFSFTNRDGAEKHKGKRIMDRIRPFVEVVYVNGENKRGKY